MSAGASAADICWQRGVTPGGHAYQVRYVPRQAITAAASGQAHNYVAVAIAFPGSIWASDDVPCSAIPWEHEEMHLDGWVHNADGRWIGQKKSESQEAARTQPPTPWFLMKVGADYRLLRDTELAATTPSN